MKRTLKVVTLIAILAVVLLSMTACGKTKIDIAEGMTVVFTGADGSGRAEITYPNSDDTPPYIDKILESEKIDATDWSTWLVLGNAISCEVEPSAKLSNGDKVTVTIEVDEAILENLDISAEDQQITFAVEGLTEVIAIHPFENFEISFTGIAPAVYAEFTQSQVINDVGVSYTIEEQAPYRAGDTLTVKASIGNNEYYRLAEDTMQVAVSGVDKYIDSSAEILPETMEAMRAKADQLMVERFAVGAPTDFYQYDGYEYAGYVFMAADPESAFIWKYNSCFLMYTVNVIEDGQPYTSTYYYRFNDILQHQDGTQEVNINEYERPANNSNYDLKNYQTIDARYGEIESVWGDGMLLEKLF